MTKRKKRYVVICTDRRGVFGGWLESGDGPGPVTITEARQCLYWPSGGVPGLASEGPIEKCRLTAPAPRLRDTAHAIFDASDKAREAWLNF